MATHSSVLAWRIPGTGESGELPSMGSHRVGHDGSDLAAADCMKGKGFSCPPLSSLFGKCFCTLVSSCLIWGQLFFFGCATQHMGS